MIKGYPHGRGNPHMGHWERWGTTSWNVPPTMGWQLHAGIPSEANCLGNHQCLVEAKERNIPRYVAKGRVSSPIPDAYNHLSRKNMFLICVKKNISLACIAFLWLQCLHDHGISRSLGPAHEARRISRPPCPGTAGTVDVDDRRACNGWGTMEQHWCVSRLEKAGECCSYTAHAAAQHSKSRIK